MAVFATATAVAPFACLGGFVAFAVVPLAPLDRLALAPVPAPFRLADVVAGGERSTVASAATRREPFRAGRAAGTISAGRSARVRGATMVREV